MIRSIIVATSENQAIGINNDLPWHLSADLKHFKKLTSGHHIVMGRKTYESIGRPLPNRTSVIVTRNEAYTAEGCIIVHNLKDGLEKAKQSGEDEVFIIGGAQLYQLALAEGLVDKIYLTEVETKVDGDAFFPKLPENEWQETSREHHNADEKNPFAFSFVELTRRNPS